MKSHAHRSHQHDRHTISTPRASTMALAISLLFPVAAHAVEYLIANEADLRTAISTASTNGDTNAVIKMTANFTMSDSTAFPASTVPVTIDTNGFVLTRAPNLIPNPANIPVDIPAQYTFNGDYVGAPDTVGAGHGLSFAGGGLQNTVTVNGNVTGGNRTVNTGGGGVGVNLASGSMTLINNGVLTGGQMNNVAAGTNTLQSTGVGFGSGSAVVINNGTIQGGAGINGLAGAGIGIISAGNGSRIVNNGMIRGGSESGGGVLGGAGILNIGGSSLAIENNASGTIEGGVGGAGISGTGRITNNGLIKGGDGAVAISSTGANITNNSQITGGTGASAIFGASSSTTITNTGQITGDTGFAAISAANTAIVTVINSGTITATGGANAITFGATTGRGTLELRAGSVINGNVVAGAGTLDTLTLGGTTDSTFDLSAIGAKYQGFDRFSKTGTSTWTVSGTSAATGPWTVSAGKLALNGEVTGNMTVSAAGTLGGNATVNGNVTNSGIIAPGNSIGTILINGDYTGNNGTLEIESQLAGTGSPADKLLITGNVSGTTTVKVTNVGGTGAATGTGNTDGISIIQVAGTSSANAFQLAGGYVAAGPYKYALNVFDPASSAAGQADPLLGGGAFYDYRLQSLLDASGNPVTVPQIAAYQGMSTGAVRYGTSLLDSVHKRLGELRRSESASIGNGTDQNSQFFMRAQGSSSDVSGNRSAGYDQDIWFTQAGGNFFGKDMEDGATLRIGGAFSYGESKLNVDNSSAKVNLDGTTVALTSTYQAAKGWYLDGVAQVTKYSADIRTGERGQTGSPDGLGYGLSVEGGYPIDLGNHLIIEPQAQLAYQMIKFDRFNDADNISVDLRDGESLRGRFGGRLQKTFDANTTRAWSPYVEANLLHEFLGGGSIRAGNVSFATDSLGTSVQLGGGINAQLGANKVFFASVSYESGVSDAAADAWSGNIGVRVNW